MVIEQWTEIKYHYVIVFILSTYLIGGALYSVFNFRQQDLKKLLIKVIISAIIAISLSLTIYIFSYKTVHIVYKYDNELEIELFLSKQWVIVEHSKEYQRIHFKKEGESYYENVGRKKEN